MQGRNPAGVSLALYAGITIDGVVGLTCGIQYSTNLSIAGSSARRGSFSLSSPEGGEGRVNSRPVHVGGGARKMRP